MLLTLADPGGGARGATLPPSKSRPNSFKCRQNAPFCVLVFKSVYAVPNRFKYRPNAPSSVLDFKMFSLVPNRFKSVRMHHLASLFLTSSLQFQIVSNTVRSHSLCLDLSLKFQISFSNSVRMFHFTVHVFKIIRLGRPTTSRTKS